jgi:hypothetical protein
MASGAICLEAVEGNEVAVGAAALGGKLACATGGIDVSA